MAKEEWRWIVTVMPYLEQVATLLALSRAVGEGLVPSTVLCATRRAHTAVLPTFPDYFKDIDLEFCKTMDLEGIDGRIVSGGGTAMLDKSFPLCGLAADMRDPRITTDITKQYEGFLTAWAEGLKEKLGLELRFRPVNDLEIKCKDGRMRKVSNMGGGTVGNGVFRGGWIYRTDTDYDLVDKVVTPPPEKFADKEEKTMRAYSSSLSREFGREVTIEEVLDALKWGVCQKYGVTLVPGELTEKEKEYGNMILNGVFKNERYLYDRCEAKKFPIIPLGAKRGEALHKVTHGPFMRVTVLTEQNKIRDILITGTMHTSPLNPIAGETPIHEVERRVRGLPIDEKLIREKVEEVFALEGYEIANSTAEDFVKPIMQACEQAA
jgi:lipoate-protein ligase A